MGYTPVMRIATIGIALLLACGRQQPPVKAVKIAYVSGGAIMIADPDGQNAAAVGSALPKGDVRDLACSRDGKSIACSVGMMGTDVHTVPLDGAPPVHVSKGKKGMVGWGQPAWSSDGRRIACVVGDMFAYNLWLVERDGSNPRNVTNEAKMKISWPSWSPDGSKIAYVGDAGVESGGGRSYGLSNLWVVHADGSGKRQITTMDGEIHPPAWSPDSRRLLFAFKPVKSRDQNVRMMGSPDVWRVNADGSDARNLTNNSGKDENYWPSWSPDGSRIALVARKNGGPCSIYVMDQDGSNVKALLEPKWGPEYSRVHWSPDGSRLMFQDGRDKIMVMNADGTGISQVATGTSATWVPVR